MRQWHAEPGALSVGRIPQYRIQHAMVQETDEQKEMREQEEEQDRLAEEAWENEEKEARNQVRRGSRGQQPARRQKRQREAERSEPREEDREEPQSMPDEEAAQEEQAIMRENDERNVLIYRIVTQFEKKPSRQLWKAINSDAMKKGFEDYINRGEDEVKAILDPRLKRLREVVKPFKQQPEEQRPTLSRLFVLLNPNTSDRVFQQEINKVESYMRRARIFEQNAARENLQGQEVENKEVENEQEQNFPPADLQLSDLQREMARVRDRPGPRADGQALSQDELAAMQIAMKRAELARQAEQDQLADLELALDRDDAPLPADPIDQELLAQLYSALADAPPVSRPPPDDEDALIEQDLTANEQLNVIKSEATRRHEFQLWYAVQRLQDNALKGFIAPGRLGKIQSALGGAATQPKNQADLLFILDHLSKKTTDRNFNTQMNTLQSHIRMAPFTEAIEYGSKEGKNELARTLRFLQSKEFDDETVLNRISRLLKLFPSPEEEEEEEEVFYPEDDRPDMRSTQSHLLDILKLLTSQTDENVFNEAVESLVSQMKTFENPELRKAVQEIDFNAPNGVALRTWLQAADQILTRIGNDDPTKVNRLKDLVRRVVNTYRLKMLNSNLIDVNAIRRLRNDYLPKPRIRVGGLDGELLEDGLEGNEGPSEYEAMILSLLRTLSNVFDPRDVADVALALMKKPSLTTFAHLVPNQSRAKSDLKRLQRFVIKHQAFDSRKIAKLVERAGSDAFEPTFKKFQRTFTQK